MATNYISVYPMSEDERALVRRVMSVPVENESFLTGEVDDDAMAKLKAAGIIVQTLTPRPAPPLQPQADVGPQSARRGRQDAVRDMDVNPAPQDYYRVKLRGPLLEPWREKLAAFNVVLGEAMASGGNKTKLALSDVARVRSLDFVTLVEWIQPTESVATTFTQSAAPTFGMAAPRKMLTFDIRLNNPEARDKVEAWLTEHHLKIAGSSGRKIRFFALEDADELNDLATLPEVDTIAEYVEPTLSNDVSRVLLAVDTAPSQGATTPVTVIPQDGSGQIVAVADTGIDDQHPDFQGRIVGKIARGRPNDTSDPNGHGTHVSGSVLGDGTASSGGIRGIAPKASLFFQSLLDANGKLTGLPLDLNDLFKEAYQSGARIHNNSWGAETPSIYAMNSEEVDEFVRANPDMLVVIAAGNAGTAAKPFHSSQGSVDWLSIGSPASSKNALTVGACRSSRVDGPLAKTTWGAGWPTKFPAPPIASEFISGNSECMAAFSSRGPCDDHRTKPDLVAPGTDIASTRSSLAPAANFWGPNPNPKYAYDGGTSMATPLVSGCAALVRQYFVDKRGHKPSAALLKAALINSTVWLTGADAVAPSAGTPNFHQGYGRVCMTRAIPNTADPQFTIQFIDEWETPAAALVRTGERRRYTFVLAAGTPELRVCLAYTDAPARALQNNVNLIVQNVDTGQKWVGNTDLPDRLTPLDTTNNVECVRVLTPDAGNYVVQIVASNLLKPPQDFALLVTGSNLPKLDQI